MRVEVVPVRQRRSVYEPGLDNQSFDGVLDRLPRSAGVASMAARTITVDINHDRGHETCIAD